MARPRKETSEVSPTKKTTRRSASTTKPLQTAAERKAFMENLDHQIPMQFKEAQQSFKQLRDVTKNVRQTTISSYSKEDVIRYLQNIDSYEEELRGLSRYLFYRCQVYFRLIMYNATMFDLNARYIVPNYDLTKDNDKDKMLKSYYDTAVILDRMSLQTQMMTPLINNFIEDVFYGCCWLDDTGMFILKIPPEYCKISGRYPTGDFAFWVDMSKYKKYEAIIDMLGEPMSSMYKAYGGNSTNKWQLMPDEYAMCTKSRVESWETAVPIFSGLFLDLIGLLNLADVQAVADEQQIYKLIVATLPLLNGANDPDQFAVDVDLALDYYKKLEASLPPYLGSVISPIPLNTISFSDDQATDTTKVQKATKELLNTSGGAQVLNSSTLPNAEAVRSANRVDAALALSSLLGQIQGWVNRMLSYQLSNPCKVKFFNVSIHTKDALRESFQKDLQYDSTKMLLINSLDGISELDTLSLSFMSNDVLNLKDKFLPLTSANTVSASETGAPTKSDTEISDEGDNTRQKK